MLFGIRLIKRYESPSVTLSLFGRIDRKRVKHHDFPLPDIMLPLCILIFGNLYLVDNCHRYDFAVIRHHEQIVPSQSILRGFPGGINMANPARC